MDSLLKRALAYLLDLGLIMIVVSCVSNSNINPQIGKYRELYASFSKLQANYYEQQENDIKTCDDLKKAIDDKKLTEQKYLDDYNNLEKEEILEEEYNKKCLTIVNSYNDNKMTQEEYTNKFNYYYQQLQRASSFTYILDVVVTLLYVVLFQKYTNGQTLGKKIMRLKVVPVKGEQLTYKQLLLRNIFLFSIFYHLLMIITSLVVPEKYFVLSSNILYLMDYFLSIAVVGTMFFNKQRRGLHDMVAKTRVALFDFNGNELEEKNFFSLKIKEDPIPKKQDHNKKKKDR